MCGNCYDRRLYIPQRGGVVVIVNLIVSNSCRDNPLRSYCTIGYLHQHCLSVCALGMRVCLTMKRGPVPLDKALDPSSNVPLWSTRRNVSRRKIQSYVTGLFALKPSGRKGLGPDVHADVVSWLLGTQTCEDRSIFNLQVKQQTCLFSPIVFIIIYIIHIDHMCLGM